MTFIPFPNKPWFLCVCSKCLLKTLWEREKLLIRSKFSFCQSVFNPFGELSPFSSNLNLSSANSLNFEGCKICHWARVHEPQKYLGTGENTSGLFSFKINTVLPNKDAIVFAAFNPFPNIKL